MYFWRIKRIGPISMYEYISVWNYECKYVLVCMYACMNVDHNNVYNVQRVSVSVYVYIY